MNTYEKGVVRLCRLCTGDVVTESLTMHATDQGPTVGRPDPSSLSRSPHGYITGHAASNRPSDLSQTLRELEAIHERADIIIFVDGQVCLHIKNRGPDDEPDGLKMFLLILAALFVIIVLIACVMEK